MTERLSLISSPSATILARFDFPCTPQKVDPALIARLRAAMLGCFVPVDPTTPPAS